MPLPASLPPLAGSGDGENGLPTWDAIYRKANQIASERGEPAGYPRLIPGHALIVEPTHEFARNQGGDTRIDLGPVEGDDEQPRRALSEQEAADGGVRLVNSWWCERRAVTVNVFDVNGRRRAFTTPDHSWPWRLFKMALPSLGIANHFHYRAEQKAQKTLAGMVTENQFNQYILTGSFLESSPRSRVCYLFRRGRPTIAIGLGTGKTRFLSALCLHPLGYYEQTGMGALVPTDDVIAHLLMMRGAESLFWRKANHHPAHTCGAAI